MPEEIHTTDLPRDVHQRIEELWQKLEALPAEQAEPVRQALGLWCAAREPLPLSVVARLTGCSGEARARLEEATRPFLAERQAAPPDGEAGYAPANEAVPAFVLGRLDPAVAAAQHRNLAAWPPVTRSLRPYVLRHGIHHLIEAGDWREVEGLGFDVGYLVAQCRELGLEVAQQSAALAEQRAATPGANPPDKKPWRELVSVLQTEVDRLCQRPLSLPTLLLERLRDAGRDRKQIAKLLSLPKGIPRLSRYRPLQDARKASPKTAARKAGHAEEVRGCAVTPDGKRAVSASADRTLRVWDLETGQQLWTLRGHEAPVNACAVTADGQKVVSGGGADDDSIRIWDLSAAAPGQSIEPRTLHAGLAPDTEESDIADPDHRSIFSIQLTANDSVYFGDASTISNFAFIYGTGLDKPFDTPEFCWSRGMEGLEAENARLEAENARLEEENAREEQAFIKGDPPVDEQASMAPVPLVDEQASTEPDPPVDEQASMAPVPPLDLKEDPDAELSTELVNAMEANPELLGDTVEEAVRKVFAHDPEKRDRALAGIRHAQQELAAQEQPQKENDVPRAALENVPPPVFAVTLDERIVIAEGKRLLVKKTAVEIEETTIPMDGHTDVVTACVVIPPQGRRLVSGSRDRTLRVWDLLTHELIATIEGHSDPIAALATTPDGKRLISASGDTLRVWDLETLSWLESYTGNGVFQCVAAAQDRVVAGDADGNVWMFELAEPPAPGKGTVPLTGPVRRRHALLVGIRQYDDGQLKTLPYCVNDARDLERVLDERGYHVRSLHDAHEEPFLLPTLENIRTELSLLQLHPDDMLVVHFSCHGVGLDKERYLFARDSDHERVAGTCLPLSEVIARMAATGARRQVLLLDACYAGVGLFGRGDGPKVNLDVPAAARPEAHESVDEAPAPQVDRPRRAELDDPAFVRETYELAEGFALLAASTGAEISRDRKTRENGLFSSLLIDGLQGKADRDGKGFVTVDDLKEYVLTGTKALVATETKVDQTPTIQIHGKGDMVLVRL